jgi:putative heme-binding domain-containing protein
MYFKTVRAQKAYATAAIGQLQKSVTDGKKIFDTRCASCHRIKDNAPDIGPDLTMISKKFDRDNLLAAIIDPSAAIVFGYEAWTINLKDGQSFFGFLLADGEQTITIKDLTGKKHIIPVTTIASRKQAEKSLMPSADVLGLSEQDLADVSEYLLKL